MTMNYVKLRCTYMYRILPYKSYVSGRYFLNNVCIITSKVYDLAINHLIRHGIIKL